MKTPLDNFEVDIESNTIHHKIVTSVVLKHKTLPILFRETSYDTTKFNVRQLTEKIYRELFLWYKQGKAQTHILHHINHKIHPLGKSGFLYQPEWDKEKEAWFILDENNNKVYE